jgi:hypothetical protein
MCLTERPDVCGCGWTRLLRLTRVWSNRVRAVASASAARAHATLAWGAEAIKISTISRRVTAATARALHMAIHIDLMTA